MMTPRPNYLPNSLALLCSLSPLPFALAVQTLKKMLLKMPNLKPGHHQESSPLKEATRRCFFSRGVVVKDQRSFSARISIRWQDFTKTETLLKPHPSRMTVVVWLMASSTSSLRKEVSGPTRISQSWSRDQKSGKFNPFPFLRHVHTKLTGQNLFQECFEDKRNI